jgi:phosphoglycerate dehydrogenase-like enzyme
MKKQIMLVKSTGLGQKSIDTIIAENKVANYVIVDDNHNDIYGSASGVNAIIGCPRFLMKPELLKIAGAQLQWVHALGAGIDTYLFKEFVESNIILTNGKIIQGPEVADHALALLLMLTRNLHFYVNQSKSPREVIPRPIELRGKTAVVIGGGGGIGMLIAERLSSFGMKVISIEDKMINMVSFIQEQHPIDRLFDVIPLGDVIIMAAPLTKITKNIINKKSINIMKDNCVLINVTRGETVNTNELLNALDAGKFLGVGLDVTDPEPLQEDHRLREIHRVILTPHVAGPSDLNRVRSYELVKANVRRFLASKPLFNMVNKFSQS